MTLLTHPRFSHSDDFSDLSTISKSAVAARADALRSTRRPRQILINMSSTAAAAAPAQSAISSILSRSGAKSESQALPLEILHNLQHQHRWTDLRIHMLSGAQLLDVENPPPSYLENRRYLVSGLPLTHRYVHPDLQNHLIRHGIDEADLTVQREWALPVSLGERWNLKKLSAVFDALPERPAVELSDGKDLGMKWKDAKRVLMGMLPTNGMGGDGTVVYYILQEGEVKPRQNG